MVTKSTTTFVIHQECRQGSFGMYASEMVSWTSLTLPRQFCDKRNHLQPTTSVVENFKSQISYPGSHPLEYKQKTFARKRSLQI